MSGKGSDRTRLRSDNRHPIEMEGILINILSKLPVKDVASCKLVAKHWLSLLSKPGFPLLQLTWSRKSLKYIICPYPLDHDIVNHLCVMEDDEKNIQDIPLPGFEYMCSPEIICFSNGLICIVEEDCEGLAEIDIQIFNPIAHDSILLPRGSQSRVIPTVGIAFDPKTADFKAFRFFTDVPNAEDFMYKCEAYTSSSKEWRLIAEDVQRPEHSPDHTICPCFASIAGAIYWFGWSVDDPGTPVCILSVDMNDKFSELALPTQLNHWSFVIELEGCLSVVQLTNPESYIVYPHPYPPSYVEVYKFDSREWKLISKSEIDLINIASVNSVAARDNEIFFIFKLEDETNSYRIFDLVGKTFKNLDLDDNFADYSPVAFPSAESLLKCSEE